MTTFFIADTHFGDAALVRRRRGMVDSVEGHDEALIARCNTTIAQGDEVF